ncbi:MAG: hypothetical protein K8R92_09655 [Planctomycetes bacterium]|nr:hypothetical protein [Planctomycetota bacterium]
MGNWTSRISTIFVAMIATLLIWTWAADRTREIRELKGTVAFRSSDPAQHFVDPTKTFAITLSVKASPASIERIQTLLDEGVAIPSGTENFPGVDGTYNVMLASAINDLPQVIATDATVLASRPESAKVLVGSLTTTQYPLVVKIPLADFESASVDPSVALVTLPASAAEAVKGIQVEAVVDAKDLTPGMNRATAKLRLPESVPVKPEQVTFVPDHAEVTFTLRRKTESLNLATVGVQIAGSPTDLKGFDVVINQEGGVLRDVTLVGPPDALKEIESGKFTVTAIVPLTSGDLGSKIAKKAVQSWILPPRVSVESVGGKQILNPEIALKIEPKPTTSTVPDAEPAPVTPKSP